MKCTISERTVTIETTRPGEMLTKDTVQALTQRTTTWEDVKAEANHLLAAPVKSDDLFEGITYPEIPEDLLAMEPANFLPAE